MYWIKCPNTLYIIMEKYPNLFQAFTIAILCVKIAFITCSVLAFYTKRNKELKTSDFWLGWKHKFHISFSIMMSVLLVLLFSNLLNKGTVCIDGHLKLYLSTFGILSLFDFLHEYN